jgi:DNA-binding NarL/FixJ family response regulator
VPARILIADDSQVVRQSLNSLISEHPDWVVCGEAPNGTEAVQLAEQFKPDLIILDMAMPGLNGLMACAQILRASPLIPIVIYTLHQSSQVDLEGKKAGARQVLSKSDDAHELIRCIEELLAETLGVTPYSDRPQPTGSADVAADLKTNAPRLDQKSHPKTNAKGA